ncbi:uncharacterized protein BJX67DRAFT_31861 [Aspergillus lucknowensis]|uniref:Uncharacterized protein n=1 Tax=Aspergillus lucknowensis TaxID=176173 RepID=A0ABR4LX16_9EURO
MNYLKWLPSQFDPLTLPGEQTHRRVGEQDAVHFAAWRLKCVCLARLLKGVADAVRVAIPAKPILDFGAGNSKIARGPCEELYSASSLNHFNTIHLERQTGFVTLHREPTRCFRSSHGRQAPMFLCGKSASAVYPGPLTTTGNADTLRCFSWSTT